MISLIVLIITIALYMLVGIAAIAVAFVIATLCAIGYKTQKDAAAKKQPSKRICPMCGSADMKFQYIVNGTTSTGSATTVSGVGIASGSSKVHHRNMAHCESCGYTFDFVTQDDINAEYNKLKANEGCSIAVAAVLGVILAIIFFFGR